MPKTNPQTIDELLQLFVGDDDRRPKFLRPWREGAYVFASDTYILIRVKEELTDADYPSYGDGKTNSLFPTCPTTGILTSEKLAAVISNAPLTDEEMEIGEDVECEECNGEGTVTWEYKDWRKEFDCPCCDGTGYSERVRYKRTGNKVIAYDAAVKINGTGHKEATFGAGFLDLILDVMKYFDRSEVPVTLTGSREVALFHITEDVDIILMPYTAHTQYETISLIPIQP